MKKILLLLCFFAISLSVSAQTVLKLKATAYAYQMQNDYGIWQDWSDWERCNTPIVMDDNTDRVTIYSPEIQKYDLYDFLGEEVEPDGMTTLTWLFVDQDGDPGTMRLVSRPSGNVELYIDFANIRWAYTVIAD